MARPLSNDVRERIVDAAGAAFYEHGYAAMGVDALADAAGVSKMTLYRYFPSKDDLIVAVLHRFDAWGVSNYEEIIGAHKNPVDRLLALFDWIAERANDPSCRGCVFQNSAAEFPEHEALAHEVSLNSKRVVRATYLREAELMKARDPEELADQLLLLTDGCWAVARMWGPNNPSRSVLSAAKVLIRAQQESPSTLMQHCPKVRV